jgi:hypothetical protein
MRALAAVILIASLSLRPAAAEIYSLATTPPGSFTYTLAAAIAAAGNKKDALLRVQTYGNSAQFLPLVESGEVAFALTNVLDLDAAIKGEGGFAGRPATHLRAVAFLFPFQTGFLVRVDSDVKTPADVKGKRVPLFSTQPTFQAIMRAVLANAGLGESDIEYVPLGNFTQQYDEFAAGHIDVALSVPGQSAVADLKEKVGALRFLPLDNGANAIGAMQAVLPLAYVTEVKPNPNFVGVEAPLAMLSYDYVLFVNDGVADAAVAELVQRLRDNADVLAATAPKFKSFKPETMAKSLPLPYHPGAEAYYRANGLWPTQ